jgi:hypothetical protein
LESTITYPSSETSTRLLTFGDWGISKEGNQTLRLLNERVDSYNMVLFLGDIAYDLNTNNGTVGNDFLTYAMNITSRIPFQVNKWLTLALTW